MELLRRDGKNGLLIPSAVVGLGILAGNSGWFALKPAQAELPQVVASTAQAPSLLQLNDAFTLLAERASPSVVNIYTKARERRMPGYRGMPRDQFDLFFGNPFEQGPREAEALGSGFVYDAEKGYIITNSHVVQMAGRNADEIMVKFNGEENGQGHLAKVIGVDEDTDVALLQLQKPRSGLAAAVLGDSDRARVGEWVVAIGNPYGHTHSITQGLVSAKGRSLEGIRAEFLQTSASINPGNSGGPLINLAGEVIGINTAIDPRAQGIGFAIPINTAKNVISQLVEKGRVSRAWLGIGIHDLNADIAGTLRLKSNEGVLVRQIVRDQPAARAGMELGDIIRKINGTEIKTSRDLFRTVDKIGVGSTAKIEIERGGQMKVFSINLTERPSD